MYFLKYLDQSTSCYYSTANSAIFYKAYFEERIVFIYRKFRIWYYQTYLTELPDTPYKHYFEIRFFDGVLTSIIETSRQWIEFIHFINTLPDRINFTIKQSFFQISPSRKGSRNRLFTLHPLKHNESLHQLQQMYAVFKR